LEEIYEQSETAQPFEDAISLQHLLLNERRQLRIRPGSLIILDEAGLASTEQLHSLAELVKQSDSRLLLVGDPGQHSSVEAGDAFRMLLKYSAIERAKIKQVMRQKKDAMQGIYRQVAKDLSNGNISLAFCRFDNIDEFGSVLRRYNLRPLAQSHVELGLRRFLIQDGRRGKANLIYGLMRTKMIRDIGGFRLWNPLEYAVDMNQVFRILTCGQLALSNSLLFHKRLSPSEAAWLNACGSASMGSKKVHVDIDTWRRVVSMFDGYGKALSDSSLDIDTKRRLSRIIVRQKRKLKRQLGVAISAMIWYRIKGAARQTFVGKGLVRARRWLTGS